MLGLRAAVQPLGAREGQGQPGMELQPAAGGSSRSARTMCASWSTARCLRPPNLKHWHGNLSRLTRIIACLTSFCSAMEGLLWSGQKRWKTYSVAYSEQLLCKHTRLRWSGFEVGNAGFCRKHKSQNWNVTIYTGQIPFVMCHRCTISYQRFPNASLKILFTVFALKIL